jgi:hypothetical protein
VIAGITEPIMPNPLGPAPLGILRAIDLRLRLFEEYWKENLLVLLVTLEMSRYTPGLGISKRDTGPCLRRVSVIIDNIFIEVPAKYVIDEFLQFNANRKSSHRAGLNFFGMRFRISVF